jgi:small multidrug resistance pump
LLGWLFGLVAAFCVLVFERSFKFLGVIMLTWTLLAAAIITEVTATVALKMSDGFSRLVPSTVVVAGYLVSFWLLGLILTRGMSLGVVYAVWSAFGVALIVLIDVVWFDERLTSLQTAGLFAVVLGIAALELGGSAS